MVNQSTEQAALFSHILLIEDEPSHALLIKRALKNYAGNVSHAEDLNKAMDFLTINAPELIISDLNLPGSIASATIPRVMTLAKDSGEIPVIVLTSSTSINDAISAMQAGARDYIVKTLDSNFSEAIGLALHRAHKQIELEKAKRKLQSEMEALTQSIESSNDCVALVDDTEQITYCNNSFKNLASEFGTKTDTIINFFPSNFQNLEQLTSEVKEKLKSLTKGAVWQSEISIKGEKTKAYELTLSGIRDNLSLSKECVLWIRDISESRRREQIQREIISTTSHDLKGPLGAILISAELANEQTINPEKKSALITRIHNSAQGAINLIEDMLSAKRIQDGNFILRPTSSPLSKVISDILIEFSPLAETRKIKLSSDIPDSIDWKIDALGIHRAISNLVSNAIKFTPANGEIHVSLITNNDSCSIRVSDTGSGMEPGEVSRIFDRYGRLAKHQQITGSGLGLFVTKSIVTAHGGRIEVQSKLNEGTTFTVILPKEPPINERGELISMDFG